MGRGWHTQVQNGRSDGVMAGIACRPGTRTFPNINLPSIPFGRKVLKTSRLVLPQFAGSAA
jgi:hypothetical protein